VSVATRRASNQGTDIVSMALLAIGGAAALGGTALLWRRRGRTGES
jgi:LPXTG-motif cell wall-anchored protein